MNKQLLYFIIAVSLISCYTPKKFVQFTESKNELADEGFSKILLVSTGQSGTNFFLEGLSEQLNKKLASKKIQFFFTHLGNNQIEANAKFTQLIKDASYDAVLQFAQLDNSQNPIFAYSTSAPFQSKSTSIINHQAVRYQQKFLIKFFDFNDLSTSKMDGNLDVSIDFLNPRDYSTLVDQLIKSLHL